MWVLGLPDPQISAEDQVRGPGQRPPGARKVRLPGDSVSELMRRRARWEHGLAVLAPGPEGRSEPADAQVPVTGSPGSRHPVVLTTTLGTLPPGRGKAQH